MLMIYIEIRAPYEQKYPVHKPLFDSKCPPTDTAVNELV